MKVFGYLLKNVIALETLETLETLGREGASRADDCWS
jgi:hypothetical protein